MYSSFSNLQIGMIFSTNRRLLLAIWLFLFLINSFSCETSDNKTSSDDDKILNEKQIETLLSTKLEQLSLAVHRKNEGDRIRKKRQSKSNYLMPGDGGKFLKTSILINFKINQF